jgi:D-alanyl-D-alanine carboxypeptidase/D-alanyl-D-alanine-endopeptidase (penicillin-binding protein 4)
MRLFRLLLLASVLTAAAPLKERIDRVLASSEGARHAFWGIQITSLKDGVTLYERNSGHFFVPASNTKLFTTALALSRLGPDHRFLTRVVADQAVDASGRIAGDVRLVGGGDPTLSARAIPYRVGPPAGNPLQSIEDFADAVAARDVRRIDGDIVGDDTAYIWQPYGQGWSYDDQLWEYGAPVSALTVNDNSFSLTIKSAREAGGPAMLSLLPQFEYFLFDNRIGSDPQLKREISIERFAGSRQVRLWGNMPPGEPDRTLLLAVDDPALYAARVFYDALSRRGIAITGSAVARHRFGNEPDSAASGVELARRTSPPLVDILRVIDKVSQNLHAELMLREVGKGSRRAGLEAMHVFLTEAGIEPGEYTFADGSGLSRLNMVTPSAVVKLLRFMYRSPNQNDWILFLPIGGEDGTLASRFAKAYEARGIYAKTGALSHVSALSGYLEPFSQNPRAFSIFVNNYNAPSSEPRTRTIDRICITAIEKE